MKKLGVILVLLLCVIMIGCGNKPDTEQSNQDANNTSVNSDTNSQNGSDLPKSNPIDNNFNDAFNASSINEYNIISSMYSASWNNELKNVARSIRQCYKFPEDQKLVENFVASCEDLAQKASEMEMLNWEHTSEPPEERSSFTSAAGAVRMAEANTYKDATLHLIEFYNSMPDRNGGKYKFIYEDQGPLLEGLRAEMNK